jgi:hypothetical protein
VTAIWEDMTFRDLQSPFFDWMEYCGRPIENEESTLSIDIKKSSMFSSHDERGSAAASGHSVFP